MDVFEYRDYRAIIRALIESKPKKGYGQLSQLAAHIGVNPTYVSQVLNGSKNFTEDQGFQAAAFFELGESETFYFLLLIQRERVAGHQVKKLLDREILTRQRGAQRVRGRIEPERELSFESQAVYYSDWLYTAVHTLSSIEGLQSVDAVSQHLDLPRARVVEVIKWLLQVGLCKEHQGKLIVGPLTTFADRTSPLARRHHANWRQKAVEAMERQSDQDFFFTAPFSVSLEDFDLIRKQLVRLIEDVSKRVSKTDPEIMATIGVDLFRT
jgi:uncharacterized protein (TIGR02147 family)